MIKNSTEEGTRLIYSAKFIHCYEMEDDIIFVVRLLEDSVTHPHLTQGIEQIILMKRDDILSSDFEYSVGDKVRAYNDPLCRYGVGSNYHNLIGQSYTFTLEKYRFDWVLKSIEPLPSDVILNGLIAYSGHILDVAINSLSLEVLIKVDKDAHVLSNQKTTEKKTYYDNNMKSFVSYYFDLSVYNENAIRFTETFGPYVSYNENFESSFSNNKLVFIESTPSIFTFESLTSLDSTSQRLLKVIPYTEHVKVEDYYGPGF